MTARPTFDVDLADLDTDPYPALAAIRRAGPIAWIPSMEGWLVTRRDLVVTMMRDPETFTVDDPRFSTAQVVGPSMLSLDGAQHARHREPFAEPFRSSEVRRTLGAWAEDAARGLVDPLAHRRSAEIRADLAAPLAVETVARSLGLVGSDPDSLRAWYDDIVEAVSRASTGQVAMAAPPASMAHLADHVRASVIGGSGLVAEVAATLAPEEVISNAAVIMFGAIETVEGTIAAAVALILEDPAVWDQVSADAGLIANAVEEAMRFAPAVMQVDRYATRAAEVEGVTIEAGDFVMLSIAGANRDPAVFAAQDVFDPTRANARSHVTFAHGPHACLGLHLARLEANAAITALGRLPGLHLTDAPVFEGLVFRKPRSVRIAWSDSVGGPVLDLP